MMCVRAVMMCACCPNTALYVSHCCVRVCRVQMYVCMRSSSIDHGYNISSQLIFLRSSFWRSISAHSAVVKNDIPDII